MNKEDLKNRTKEFAHRCVKLALILPKDKLGLHLQGQLIRSSTSVAANYRAACVAQSKNSFVAKLSIVIEEADECSFWLQFIIDENLLENSNVVTMLKEANELTAIFISSRKTINLNQNKVNN